MTTTTITIPAKYPGGTSMANRTVQVRLMHGGAGGSDGDAVIGDTWSVVVDSTTGEGSIDLTPNEELTPAGTFYRFSVLGASGSVVRHIEVPVSATPISWADPAIEVLSPVPPGLVDVSALNGLIDQQTPLDDLDAADLPLTGDELLAADQLGVAVALTTEDLTPRPVDAEARRGRDRMRRHTHLTDTPSTYSATDGGMFGTDPAVVALSGTAAAITQTQGSTYRYGTAGCATGTTTTGFAAVMLAPSRTFYIDASSDWSGAAIVASDVASAGQDFTASVGWIPWPTTTAPSVGMFFRHTSASANWIAVTKAAGGETTTDTGVAVTGASTFRTLEVRRTAGGSAVFSIDGTVVATHTTRLPDALSPLGYGASIKKSAGSTSKTMHVDYLGSDINASAAAAWGAL